MEKIPLEIVEKVSDFLLTDYYPHTSMWFWLPAAIMGAVSLVNSIVQRRNDKKNLAAQNAANLALSDRQFEQNRQQIQELNQYNDPKNQMSRLMGAGLNPNLIYGSGASGASGNQTMAARYEPPQLQFGARAIQLPENMLSMYQDFSMRQAQIDNVKAQTENINARTATEGFTRMLREIQGKRADVELEQKEYLTPYQNAIIANQARGSEAKLLAEW